MSKPSKAASGSTPNGNIQVRMYDVGFGDCFLISFGYSNGKERFLLIDCGSSTEKSDRMIKVVEQIKKDCNGHLHGLVVTHRHSDHLSAFGLKNAGDILEELKPDIVVQPWTEHPEAKAEAKEAPSIYDRKELAHLKSLSGAQSFAQHLQRDIKGILPNASTLAMKRINFLLKLNIPNKKAVERLINMGKVTNASYVHAGSKSGLETRFPGISFKVLGPPTIVQSEKIKNQVKWDPNEFWKFQANLAVAKQKNCTQTKGESRLFPQAATTSIGKASPNLKWIITRLEKGYNHNLQRIVRAVDNALNNTSIILLIEVKNKALLFPGDAQIENWLYALEKSDNKNRLKKVILYKVGHHGSTNATPKRLWKLFDNRDKLKTTKRMVSLLSTKSGKHEGVPRKSLLTALESETKLLSTEHSRKTTRNCIVVNI